jgi:glycosyltransferase involved in cell wall biosynthesis
VTTGSDAAELSVQLARALTDKDERAARGLRALRFAQANFTPGVIAEQFESVLERVLHERPSFAR